MAKTGFWLKGAKGKLAGSTIYKDGNGNTVMREIVAPKNPQTDAQMLQRILMHTVMQAYSKMKSICNHSFENVTAGTQSMQTFMKRNLNFAREKVAQMQSEGVSFYDIYNFAPLKANGLVLNQYLMSTGSLPQVFTSFAAEDTGFTYIPAIKDNTYQGVIDALGLKRGDQLTFITIEGPNTTLGQNEFKYSRVILDPTNPDGSQAALSSAFISEGAINLPSIRNNGTEHLLFGDLTNIATTGIKFRNTIEGNTVLGSAVIVSRKEGNDWLRSTARLAYVPNIGVTYSLGDCLDYAKNGNDIYTSNPYYLNNAGAGDSEAVEASESEPTLPSLQQVYATTEYSQGFTLINGSVLSIEAEPTDWEVRALAEPGAEGKYFCILEDGKAAPTAPDEYTQFNSENQAALSGFTENKVYKVYTGATLDSLEYANYAFRFVTSQGGDIRP